MVDSFFTKTEIYKNIGLAIKMNLAIKPEWL